MTPNPFIELATDPVTVIAAAGYVILLVGVLAVGVPHAVRTLIEVWIDWQQNNHRDKWARLWGDGVGYIPPAMQSLKVLWACFVLFVAFSAASALLWFAGV